MTFSVGTIQGGTHAGWRRITELKAWTCMRCFVEARYAPELPRYRNQCDNGHQRP